MNIFITVAIPVALIAFTAILIALSKWSCGESERPECLECEIINFKTSDGSHDSWSGNPYNALFTKLCYDVPLDEIIPITHYFNKNRLIFKMRTSWWGTNTPVSIVQDDNERIKPNINRLYDRHHRLIKTLESIGFDKIIDLPTHEWTYLPTTDEFQIDLHDKFDIKVETKKFMSLVKRLRAAATLMNEINNSLIAESEMKHREITEYLEDAFRKVPK